MSFFVVLLLASFFGKKGLIEIYRAQKIQRGLLQEVERLEEKQRKLEREIEELKNQSESSGEKSSREAVAAEAG